VNDTIEATEADIEAGFELYAKIERSNELGLSPYVFQIYDEVLKPSLDDNVGLATKQIQKNYYSVFHKAIPTSALRDVLSQLEAANLIDLQPDPEDKRRILVFRSEK
jgi:hypothetical protein